MAQKCANCGSTQTQSMTDGYHCLECNHTTTREGKVRKGA
jgi:DNA-directed RNA polymerase subunit RPC12/RpoP